MASIYIYRNLTRQDYSIMYKGKVIDHTTTAYVVLPSFRVRQQGMWKVRETMHKNVHAFVVADNGDVQWPCPFVEGVQPDSIGWRGSVQWRKVSYNPYKNVSFVYDDTQKPVYIASAAMLTPNGVWALAVME